MSLFGSVDVLWPTFFGQRSSADVLRPTFSGDRLVPSSGFLAAKLSGSLYSESHDVGERRLNERLQGSAWDSVEA